MAAAKSTTPSVGPHGDLHQEDIRSRMFGCESAIATGSMMTDLAGEKHSRRRCRSPATTWRENPGDCHPRRCTAQTSRQTRSTRRYGITRNNRRGEGSLSIAVDQRHDTLGEIQALPPVDHEGVKAERSFDLDRVAGILNEDIHKILVESIGPC